MHVEKLKRLLLVQAIEEQDRSGAILPLADRERATREILRNQSGGAAALLEAQAGRKLLSAGHRRAVHLVEQLAERYPVVRTLETRQLWPGWATPALLVLAFLVGLGLSALDGSKRINILAFPFLGVIAWNLLVYLGLAVFAARRVAGRAEARGGADSWAGRLLARRIAPLVKRTGKVHSQLGDALGRYLREWATVASPMLFVAGRRAFHLGAAVVALGLIAGLYLQGVVLQYQAGWESTFLGPEQVRKVLQVVYGPVAGWSGIPLPATAEDVAALRWTPEGGGGDAAPWMHLIALSLAAYVVVPRLVLALLSSLNLARLRRTARPPESLVPYLRSTFGAEPGAQRAAIVSVTPYACDLPADAGTALERFLRGSENEELSVDLRSPLRYGEEDQATATLDSGAHRVSREHALVFSLAATPEEENHGAVLAAARDSAARARPAVKLRVLIDESHLLSRFGGDASLRQRLDERRRLWRHFVSDHGLEAEFVDLRTGPSPAGSA